MKKVFYGLSLSILIFTACGGDHSGDDVTTETSTTETEVAVVSTTEEVEINGVKHFIEKIGEGEPIVVLHGGPGIFHDYLVPHFKQLAQQYQVIFYDQRGCGRTDFPKDTSSINIETYVEDLEAIRNHLKIEKLNLMGHSWGALLAMKYGIKYPGNLNKLMLVSPAPSNSDYFDQTFANMQKKRSEEDTKDLIQAMMSKKFETREEETFRKVILLGDKTNLVDQTKIEELYAPIQFSATTANNLLIVNSLLERTYFNFDITNEGLENISCPTIILLGDMDNVPFLSAQSIQEKIPGCQLTVFKKSCHYPFFEVPGEFNMAVKNFLNPEYEQ
ncbi:MAG: alpha/beta fold hydrolase [Flavobacteriales bacterium]|nr:alpha/beta fold hydrolase [Flavobacteriales bacterium]